MRVPEHSIAYRASCRLWPEIDRTPATESGHRFGECQARLLNGISNFGENQQMVAEMLALMLNFGT
jgi:hypothetical protein